MLIPAENVRNFRVTSTTPGTPIALVAAKREVVSAIVVALGNNTQPVAIGGIDTVSAVAGSQNAILLSAGNSIPFGSIDLADLHLDVRVSGEGVAVLSVE